jgi:nitrate/nitrite-specific signal transduction histidine kinase
MKELINNLLGSFDKKDIGFSAKKLSAFVGVMSAVFFSYKHSTEHNIIELVTVWLLFSLLCMSVVTVEQIIKLKESYKEKQ